NCVTHDNQNTGLHLTGSAAPGPSNNLILNCDSYRNYDPPVGGNADGFSAKWTVGPGNVFRGCRAYNNSDDGWDLWMGTSPVLIDSCIAYRNGVDVWFSGSFDGNGNGFKLGGDYIATPHIVRNCLSFDNAGNTGRGFDENNNTAGQTLYNCTAFRNKGDNYHFRNVLVDSQQHVIKNCLSYSGAVSITSAVQEKNSWLGFNVGDADFLSTDTTMVTLRRPADGSLPLSTFMHLAPNSPLIDAGVPVGLPFRGKAPDLGAFEAGVLADVGIGTSLPADFGLSQNYPNPFNPSTTISYRLPLEGFVRLRVYDMLGRQVVQLVDESQQPGQYSVRWAASPMPSGVYVCRLEVLGTDAAALFVQSRKMVLAK
ncbi:MAG TPA: right-handed parallel beta-helix repeat-containing protein, partial [Bacteroidota bacterium]|nr:right-handed parallel beta-helix repeat-containing protein [Bacteroidota bacterium]